MLRGRTQITTDFSPKPVKAYKMVKEYNKDNEEKEEEKFIILELLLKNYPKITTENYPS